MLRYFTGCGGENLNINPLRVDDHPLETFNVRTEFHGSPYLSYWDIFILTLIHRITKVIRLHPLETTNVCTKICANPGGHWDILPDKWKVCPAVGITDIFMILPLGTRKTQKKVIKTFLLKAKNVTIRKILEWDPRSIFHLIILLSYNVFCSPLKMMCTRASLP